MATVTLPKKGTEWQSLKARMEEARSRNLPWYGERLFRPAYFAGEDVVRVANEAVQLHIEENFLYSKTQYPVLRRYEEEILGTLLDLLGGPEGSGGSLTAGGTESILMAVKTARDWAREHIPGAREPEIIVPRTAHPAFDKAAHFMNLRVVRLTDTESHQADPEAIARAINENTILLVGSATAWPFGITDPLRAIAALAERNGLCMHVDACVGGLILPFARKLGYPVTDFDFTVPGVTSISVDLHKYGYAAKGVSALLFRNGGMEKYQRYTFNEWPNGLYSTPNLLGSRSGGPVASAWAVMNYLGEEGYLNVVGQTMKIKKRFQEGIRAIRGLILWAESETFQFAFGSLEFDIHAVADGMTDRGWVMSRQVSPPSIHLAINLSHARSVDRFLSDLSEVVELVRTGGIRSRGEIPVYAR